MRSLETIKKLPGYEEALEQLKNEVTKKPSKKQKTKSDGKTSK